MDKLFAVAESSKKEQTPLLYVRPSAPDTTPGVSISLQSVSSSSPEDILGLLRSNELDQHTFVSALRRLQTNDFESTSFNIFAPGSLQARVLSILIDISIPNFWSVLDEQERELLATCLSSVAGINAVVARLRLFSQQHDTSREPSLDSLECLLSVTKLLLEKSTIFFQTWQRLSAAVVDSVKRSLAWKEFVQLIASGKIIGVTAQVEDILRSADKTTQPLWLSQGTLYAAWLGKGIALMLLSASKEEPNRSTTIDAAAKLLSRSFSLGYPIPLVRSFMTPLIRHETESFSKLIGVLSPQLPNLAKQNCLEYSLQWLSSVSDGGHSFKDTQLGPSASVPGFSAFVASLVESDQTMRAHFIQFLTDPLLLGSVSLDVRRACITMVSTLGTADLEDILGKGVSFFSDAIFIDHTAIIQQESLVQTLLLASGYLYRSKPESLLAIARSSNHMQGVSSRLNSSNQKARWLGMIFGTAISSLVDKPGLKLSFGTDDMQTDEATWYQRLVHVDDAVGSINDLATFLKTNDGTVRRKRAMEGQSGELPIINGKQVFGPVRPPKAVQTQIIGERVSEIVDDENDEDDDLKPYAKPDSDPEDSDEDATLVNRNKAKAPVYIRDLMRMLRDDKDHDRFQLGVKNAALLIRRKTSFGSEVADHAEEIAGILCNLQDPFETEDFDELKLQALIAILLSDIDFMGPWLSRQAFIGDYSLAQRCIMLSALGLGGRELAGLKDQDELNPKLADSMTMFPSKRLPSRLHAIYSPQHDAGRRLEAKSREVEHQLMKPIALSAADKTTSHLDAAKIRTFSSQLNNKQKDMKTSKNQLAKIFGETFFFPLLGSFQQDVAAFGTGSIFTSVPLVLVTFLKTLALLIHASGPATLHLPDITTAFWDLLLSLRVQAVTDISVLQAVLFALLTILETNQHSMQRLTEANPKQLMETQEWVEMVFERTGGGEMISEGSDDETKVRTLAAGVLVKAREIIEAYQKRLLGAMPS